MLREMDNSIPAVKRLNMTEWIVSNWLISKYYFTWALHDIIHSYQLCFQ